VTCTLTDPHDCANVRAANSALRQHLDRACDERDAALAREKAAIEEGQRLAAEVANLREEVAAWRKGTEDANRISQRERAAADAARAEADTLRHVAETVSKRAHELAGQAQTLEARVFLAEKRLASAQSWIRREAARREDREKPFPVVFDHACRECIPHGELVKPGFRCAVHEARAAAATGSSANAEEVGHAAGAGKAGPPSLSTSAAKEHTS
jgi:hypothetical protein